MSLLLVVGIAFALALDAFAVAIASSVTLGSVSPRQVFRLSFHFGLFQALMPILGWLAGLSVQSFIARWDHWAAFGLLLFTGGRAIVEALAEDGKGGERRDPTRGSSLVMLSVATSIDALAVGLSFAMLRVRVWYPSLVIGLVAATMTMVGMRIGARLGMQFGRRMEVLGGVVLIGIGVKILLQHIA
jgi:putative Mn2+ efflux pump MntP